MGYSYGWNSKSEMIAYCIQGWESETQKTETLAHCCKGNTLWTVHERTNKETGKKERWIGCSLIRGNNKNGWGYKGMSESMGPYYYSCPLTYLTMAPVENPDWRDKVIAYHAARSEASEKKSTLVPGQEIVLPDSWKPNRFVFEKIVKRSVIAISPAGKRYRLPLTVLAQATIT